MNLSLGSFIEGDVGGGSWRWGLGIYFSISVKFASQELDSKIVTY